MISVLTDGGLSMCFWIGVVVLCILAISLYAYQILSWFNALYSGAIAIGALGAGQYWGAQRRNVIQELQHSSRQIMQGDVQLEVDSLLTADRFFADSEILGELWNSYKASAGSGARIGLPDPKEVFSKRALCQRDDGSRFARLMPGALTGAGILGTFIGLVSGLYQMNLDTAEALQESIHTLTAGMQTAFITSIVGIGCSLAYSYFDQKLDNQVLTAIGDFHSALSYLVPHTTEYSLLETLAVTQQQQLADFKTFASDTLVDVVVGGFRQAMTEIVAPHMQRTTDIFEDFTKGSSEIQVQGMREMAELFNASLNQATQEQMAALANSIEDMVEWQELIRTELAALVE